MGVFFQVEPRMGAVEGAIREALETDPATVPDADAEARTRAEAATASTPVKFNVGRFVAALLLFLVILGGGVGSEAADLPDSSKALFGLATTIFGVVVGFLGGEKSAAGD